MPLNFKYADTRFIVFAILLVLAGTTMAWFLWQEGTVLVAIFLGLVVLMAQQAHLFRSRQDEDVQLQAHVQALLLLFSNIQFRGMVPALTNWSSSPQLANTIYALIKETYPKMIVEIGSGVSTLVAAYALEQNEQGQIISFDHDIDYGTKTMKLLAQHDLAYRGKVIHTPLKTVDVAGQPWTWYDTSQMDKFPLPIDLLIIDGPPTKTGPMARYPALPCLFDQLSANAVIILDDAGRASESETVQRWQKEYAGLILEFIDSPKGIAILRRGSSQVNETK